MSLADSVPLPGSASSHVAALGPPFEPVSVSSSSSTAKEDAAIPAPAGAEDKKKQKRRSLFGFGKKKGEDSAATASAASAVTTPTATTHAASAFTGEQTVKTPTALHPSKSGSAPTTFPDSGTLPPLLPAKDLPLRKTPASPSSPTATGVGGSLGYGHHGYYAMPASPGRSIGALSSSPRVSSPAGSQIFERDVQEYGGAGGAGSGLLPNSPAIPAHIATENYIPPVLDASSEAITDGHLNPDTVEIITHTHHQPAALAVAGINNSYGAVASGSSSTAGAWGDDFASSSVDKDDSASNYGSFDTTDVRRLSFISFADVVLAEQQQAASAASSGLSRESSMHVAGLTSLSAMGAINRSPSPMRSPASPTAAGSAAGLGPGNLGSSPPTSKNGSIKGLEISPSRRPIGSASSAMGSPTMSAVGSVHLGGGNGIGEIAVETMSQALRRTGSTDLSGIRSLSQSPIEGPSR